MCETERHMVTDISDNSTSNKTFLGHSAIESPSTVYRTSHLEALVVGGGVAVSREAWQKYSAAHFARTPSISSKDSNREAKYDTKSYV